MGGAAALTIDVEQAGADEILDRDGPAVRSSRAPGKRPARRARAIVSRLQPTSLAASTWPRRRSLMANQPTAPEGPERDGPCDSGNVGAVRLPLVVVLPAGHRLRS